MKKLKRFLALSAILALMGSAFSCGQTAESSVQQELSGSSGKNISDSSLESIGGETESEAESSEDSPEKATAQTGTSPSKSSSSAAVTSQKQTAVTTVKSSSSDSGSSDKSPQQNTASEGNTNQADSSSGSGSDSSQSSGGDNTGGSPSNNNSGSNNSGANNQSSGNNTGQNSGGSQNSSQESGNTAAQTPQTEPATEAPTEPENTYTGEIMLSETPQLSGSNVSSDGKKILISAGGDYLISGAVADGQIEVNTTEKVKLFLNGVSISNSTGPAIQITDAKKAVIELMDGTASLLKDGSEDKINDRVIFSNDTLEIKGGGTLNIVSGNAHGIACDDDVIIENGNFNITSIKSGIYAHDDITIKGGTLNIKGGTNGIKSKGTINISGGYSVISGGAKDEKSSVYADGIFTYTGGYVFAVGNTVTAPTESVNPYIVAGFSQSCSAGSTVSLLLNGGEAASLLSHNNFRCVMMLSPDICLGDTFAVNVGENHYGDFTIENTQNIFTLD